MFERFTEEARRAVVVATREARVSGRAALDTGDLLVALAHEDTGIASVALANAGAMVTELAAANREAATHNGAATPSPGDDAMAPDAKAALQAAARQAIADGEAEIGTGQVLVGILDQPDSPALRILALVEIEATVVRDAVLLLVKDGGRDGDPMNLGTSTPSKVIPVLLAGWDAPAPLHAVLAEQDASGDGARQWALADWLVRACTPAWLRAVGLHDAARALAELQPITAPTQAEAAGAAIEDAATALADVVPGPVPAGERAAVTEVLMAARSGSGERGAAGAITVDVPEAVLMAAAEGVSRAMAELVLRHGDDHGARLWSRACTSARKAAEAEGRSGAGRRPGGGRSVAMRAARMATGPVAIPLSLLEAGIRSARARRAKERIDSRATRAALVACCRQLVDDAAWIVAGDRTTPLAAATAPIVADLSSRLSAALGGDVLF